MPDLDGFETAAYIKRREKTRHIPIIFLTAISKELHHVFRGYSAGAVDYVLKPFDPLVLRSKVAVFIDLYEKERALRESERRFRTAFEHAPIGIALTTLDGRFLDANQRPAHDARPLARRSADTRRCAASSHRGRPRASLSDYLRPGRGRRAVRLQRRDALPAPRGRAGARARERLRGPGRGRQARCT